MVKDSSKKLNSTKAEKVKEVIVKKVEEIKPEVITPKPTIKEEIKKPSKMPELIVKPKVVKKVKKLVKTGKEDNADFIDDVAEAQ